MMTAELPTPRYLQREMTAYAGMLPTLLDRTGRYAVVTGDRLIGTFTSWEDACQAGYKEVGLDKPFLVKKIEHVETVNHFTRSLIFPSATPDA